MIRRATTRVCSNGGGATNRGRGHIGGMGCPVASRAALSADETSYLCGLRLKVKWIGAVNGHVRLGLFRVSLDHLVDHIEGSLQTKVSILQGTVRRSGYDVFFSVPDAIASLTGSSDRVTRCRHSMVLPAAPLNQGLFRLQRPPVS
jgi:hypothetical protein